MARLIGVAVGLQSIELLLVRSAFREEGVFRWSALRRELQGFPAPLRAVLDVALSYGGFMALLVVQLAAALGLAASGPTELVWILLATTFLVCVRFRGTYNGGSDAMTWVVLLGCALANLDSSLERLGLGYVAAQLVLSYFTAGAAKLQDPAWRSGQALGQLMAAPQYDAPAWATRAATTRGGRLAAWFVLAFECAFPLALASPASCATLLGLAFAFHLANALLLGLNRFVWAWLAAYPALLFWSQRG